MIGCRGPVERTSAWFARPGCGPLSAVPANVGVLRRGNTEM